MSSIIRMTTGFGAQGSVPVCGFGAPGVNRTPDTRFRKPLLSPLSYGGWCGATLEGTLPNERQHPSLAIGGRERRIGEGQFDRVHAQSEAQNSAF
jgi:hypothetical protein